MAKFYGKIGYETSSEIRPSVYKTVIVEKGPYPGDFNRNTRRFDSGSQVNGNVTISNTISIVADPFAYQNFHSIRYAEYNGVRWTVTSVEVQYPRLLLTLGDVYNGDTGPEIKT